MKSTKPSLAVPPIPTGYAVALELVREAIQGKLAKNPHYSLRAMARDLDISHGFLSQVQKGKKKLSLKRGLQFVQFFKLDEKTASVLLRSIVLGRSSDLESSQYLEESLNASSDATDGASFDLVTLELDRFKFLSEWHHVAILDLSTVRDFVSDAAWIAEQLAIERAQAEIAIRRLLRLGLLKQVGKTWLKTDAKLVVDPQRSEAAVREFHTQMIDKAKQTLASSAARDFETRDITGTTMAINPDRLPEAKRRIQKFRRELSAFLSEGECTELYQMNVQVFRLTKNELTHLSKKRKNI